MSIKIISLINHIVNADIKHQKHHALMTRHWMYVSKIDNSEPISAKILKTISHVCVGAIPITKKAEIMAQTI